MKSVIACVLFVCLVYLVERASGVCCYSDDCGRCADGTMGTPRCGYRACNFFGCNCGGGCRTASCRRKRFAFQTSNEPAELFEQIDLNGDWKVDQEEFVQAAGSVVSAETKKMRWHHEARGIVSPEDHKEKRAAATDEEFEKFMLMKEWASMDKNGDGGITMEEFDEVRK